MWRVSVATAILLATAVACHRLPVRRQQKPLPEPKSVIIRVPGYVDVGLGVADSLKRALVRVPALLFEALERREVLATSDEVYHLRAKLLLTYRNSDPILRMQLALPKAHRYDSDEVVYEDQVHVQDVTYERDAQRLVDRMLASKELHKLVAASRLALPRLPKQQASGETILAVQLPTTISVSSFAPGTVRKLGERLPARLFDLLQQRGVRATTGLDYHLLLEPRLVYDSGQVRLVTSVWGRGRRDRLEAFDTTVRGQDLEPCMESLVDNLLSSPIIADFAKKRRLVVPGDLTRPVVVEGPGSGRGATESLPTLNGPVKVVIVPLRPLGGVDASTCRILTNLLTVGFHRIQGLSTIAPGDINALLDLERRKDLLECDSTACVAEIGAALGADLVAWGEIGALGSRYNLSVNVIRADTARVFARSSRMLPRNDDELANKMPVIISEIASQLKRAQSVSL